MNILVIGKKNHIPWPYYTARGFEQNGHNTYLFYYNEYTFFDRIEKVFSKHKIQYNKFCHLLDTFHPDIIVFVSAFFIPKEYFYIAKERHIKTIGWIGDTFGTDKKEYKDIIDKLFLFDSSLVNLSQELGFNCDFLQVGYDALLHKNFNYKRKGTINFIGSHTLKREIILKNLQNFPLEIHGLKWNKLNFHPKSWTIHTQKINTQTLVQIYNTTISSINISQIENVSNGINMRIFETLACGSCLISDNLVDLTLCFEPNKEILVYNTVDQLVELLDKVQNDKKLVANIVNNAKIRLEKSQYTYKDRTNYMIQSLG